jgi:hypothetical protein
MEVTWREKIENNILLTFSMLGTRTVAKAGAMGSGKVADVDALLRDPQIGDARAHTHTPLI